jgi:ABC-type glycerol-3-phosphate transport system substrate-binding protein
MRRFFLVCVLMFVALVPTAAQSSPRVISIAVPESLETIFEEVILPRFSEAHPDITVNLTPIPAQLLRDLILPTSEEALEGYLDATEQLVSSADVVFMPPFSLSVENTRAGYFLDLMPLVASDTAISESDFVPAAWQSYQWDNGFWALPVLVMPQVIVYDAAAFDAAGLAYPTENWTFDEYERAARALTADGTPGLQVTAFDLPRFFRILTGQSFTDDSFPAQPNFDQPKLAALLDRWRTLESEGVATSGFAEDAPLRFARIQDLVDRDLSAALPPVAGLDVYGVAVSSGTNDIEGAYRLAVYLTTVPELQTITPFILPARTSVPLNAEFSLSDTAFALTEQALDPALPLSETLFGQYLLIALADENGLQTAQITAQANAAAAENRHDTVAITVPVATLPPPTEQGEIIVDFGLFTGSTELPNGDQWQDVIDVFLSKNPDITDVELHFIAPTSANWTQQISEHDCIYGYSFNEYNNEELLALDPLLAADPTYDDDDVVGDVMLEMQRDGMTYGIPFALYPLVLYYDPTLFREAGLPEPDGTWTVDQFIDSLRQLRTVTEGAPLSLDLNYSAPFELLMAAYGETPIDYTTTPPTLRPLDAPLLTTIQQVLDLAREGLIAYHPMATFFGQGAQSATPPAMIAVQMGSFPPDFARGVEPRMVVFPVGSNTTPVSFYTNSGFVFSHAPYPEACYRWLREITTRPELVDGMPAYRSVIDDPVTAAVYGSDGQQTFQRFADLMEAPNRVFIAPFGSGTGAKMFIERAFDRYVLEDADLQTELTLAIDLTNQYRECAPTPNVDILECLLQTDPTIRDNIPPHVLGDR